MVEQIFIIACVMSIFCLSNEKILNESFHSSCESKRNNFYIPNLKKSTSQSVCIRFFENSLNILKFNVNLIVDIMEIENNHENIEICLDKCINFIKNIIDIIKVIFQFEIIQNITFYFIKILFIVTLLLFSIPKLLISFITPAQAFTFELCHPDNTI